MRPMQPRFQRYGGFEEAASGSSQPPQYFNIASRSQSRDVLRPSAAPGLQPLSNRTAQSVIDETAEAPSRGERVRLTRNRVPQTIQGEPNPGMLDRAPKESYRDIMQATAAPTTASRNKKRPGENSGSPYAFPMSGVPSLPPARPSSSRDPAPNRRNKGTPKKKDDDKSKR